MLFNVLKAYAVLDKDLGYCQSMSYVTAVLLLHMEEEVGFHDPADVYDEYLYIGGFLGFVPADQGLPHERLL